MARRPPNDRAEMPFFDHLEELRQRLFYCAAGIAVGVLVACVLFTMVPGFNILEFLTHPIEPFLPKGQSLVYTHPGDKFQLYLDAGFVVALVVASPVILYQLWGFISPALYTHERKIAIPVISGIVLLFLCGMTLAYTLVLPMTLNFLLNVGSNDVIKPMIIVSEYLGFEIYMCVAFGAAFELPLVLMGLAAVGLITPMFLSKYRRYAIVGGLIGGGFITPDPTAMFIIAVPLYGLYELGIFLARIAYRWRNRRESDSDDQTRPGVSGPPDTSNGPRRLL
jgi:sec-independent protein translocase protein TatC